MHFLICATRWWCCIVKTEVSIFKKRVKRQHNTDQNKIDILYASLFFLFFIQSQKTGTVSGMHITKYPGLRLSRYSDLILIFTFISLLSTWPVGSLWAVRKTCRYGESRLKNRKTETQEFLFIRQTAEPPNICILHRCELLKAPQFQNAIPHHCCKYGQVHTWICYDHIFYDQKGVWQL